MTWFKVDDHAAFNAKVLRAGNEAFGAWTRAGSWTSAAGKDGFIPDETADLIARKKVWEKAESAGLMMRVEGGWAIHNYLKYNPTAESVASRREARAQAGSIGGRNRSQANAQALAQANAQALACDTFQPPSRPVPSRPDPVQPSVVVSAPPPSAPKVKRACRLPADWAPADETASALNAEGYSDPLSCLTVFRDYWAGAPGSKGLKQDWEGTFRNWVRKDGKTGAATNVRTFRDARPVQRWTAEQAAQPTINWADDDDEPAKETA